MKENNDPYFNDNDNILKNLFDFTGKIANSLFSVKSKIQSPLIEECIKNEPSLKKIEKLLINKENPNVVIAKTPLLHHLLNVTNINLINFEVISLLLKYKANPNLADYRGYTALHLASMIPGAHEELLPLLVRHNLNIHYLIKPQNASILHFLCNQHYYDIDILDFFIQNKIDINAVDYLNNTCLHYVLEVIEPLQVAYIEKLFQAGAKIDIPNNIEQTALDKVTDDAVLLFITMALTNNIDISIDLLENRLKQQYPMLLSEIIEAIKLLVPEKCAFKNYFYLQPPEQKKEVLLWTMIHHRKLPHVKQINMPRTIRDLISEYIAKPKDDIKKALIRKIIYDVISQYVEKMPCYENLIN